MAYLSRNVYAAVNGSTSDFALGWDYQAAAHVQVLVYVPGVEVLPDPLTEGEDYTYSTPSTIHFASAPAAGSTVDIRRETPAPAPLPTPTTLTSADLNRVSQALTFREQEAEDRIADLTERSIMAALGDTGALFPLKSLRGSKFLVFNSAGDTLLPSNGTGTDSGLREDLAEETGAALIGASGGGTVEEGLLPVVEKLDGNFYHVADRLWIGVGATPPSVDALLCVVREDGPGEVTESPHMVSGAFHSSFGGGLSECLYDDRSEIDGGEMNHHATSQSGLVLKGDAHLVQFFHDTVQITLQGPDAKCDNVYATFLHAPAEELGASFDGRMVGLLCNGIPEHYGDPGNPSYALLSNGAMRFLLGGQGTFLGNLLVSTISDGTAQKHFHVQSAGGDEVCLRLQQESYQTLDLGITGGTIDGFLRMNEVDQWLFDYETALLPAQNNHLNIGDASHQIKDTFQVNAATVSSDERKKVVREDAIGPAEALWARWITPIAYQLKDSIAANEAKAEDDPTKQEARLHSGALAQECYRLGIKAGVADPFRWGFLSRDPLLIQKPGTRPVTRKKTRVVEFEQEYVDDTGPTPVLRKRPESKVEVVKGKPEPVLHPETGEPIMLASRPIMEVVPDPEAGEGRFKLVQRRDEAGELMWNWEPMLHAMPEWETVEEPYPETELVPWLDEKGEPVDWDWSIRYTELIMFLLRFYRLRLEALEMKVGI